jgi:hypothetical protein
MDKSRKKGCEVDLLPRLYHVPEGYAIVLSGKDIYLWICDAIVILRVKFMRCFSSADSAADTAGAALFMSISLEIKSHNQDEK